MLLKQQELPTQWVKCHCHLREPNANFHLVGFSSSFQSVTGGQRWMRENLSPPIAGGSQL